MKTFKNQKVAKCLREMKVRTRGDVSRCEPKKTFKRTVYVFDLQENFIKSYESNEACTKDLGFKPAELIYCIRNKRPKNNMYYSYDKNLFL